MNLKYVQRVLLLAMAIFTAVGIAVRHDFAAQSAAAESGAGSSAAAKAHLDGKWELTATSANGPEKATLDLKVASDGKISGTVQSQYGESTITSGSLKDDKFDLRFSINAQGNPLEVTMNGTIDGDSIKGSGAAGDTEFTFTGTRAANASGK